jgi:hypothetical protein
MHATSRILLASALAAASSACADDSDGPATPPTPPSALVASFDADFAVDWFTLLHQSFAAESVTPPVASRRIAYASVAFYESLVHGMPEHRSLGGQLNGLAPLPAPPAGAMHWPSVANRAVSLVLTNLFSGSAGPSLANIANLEAANAADFADDAPDAVIVRSIDYGEQLAAEILLWSFADGFSTYNNCAYTVPVGPGLWAPTPPAFTANPLQPCWGNLRPFVLLNSAECLPLPPPPYSTAANSSFHLAAAEVRNTVNAAVPAQIAIAQFWADGGGTLTPPGHWVSIVCQVCDQQNLKLDVAAEAMARAGLAVADAFIACWEVKYAYNLLRPITYIRDASGPINDPAWVTVSGIATPPFPEFTSGHSTQSGAASVVLQDLLGAVPFTDNTHPGVWPARTFSSFLQAASEAADSRLYGGIHYRFGNERGLEMGQCVGQTILDNVEFRD